MLVLCGQIKAGISRLRCECASHLARLSVFVACHGLPDAELCDFIAVAAVNKQDVQIPACAEVRALPSATGLESKVISGHAELSIHGMAKQADSEMRGMRRCKFSSELKAGSRLVGI